MFWNRLILILVSRIIQKNYKGSLMEMQMLEEQRLMDWEGLQSSR